MSREKLHVRRPVAALLAAAGALAGVLGCQSIADIPEVTYSAICHDYCDLEFKACPGLVGQYDDPRTCLEACSALDTHAHGSRLTVGNTVSCRMKNLYDAIELQHAPSDLLQACTRGGPGGGDNCTMAPDAPDCEGYCVLYDAACNGTSDNPFKKFQDHAGTDQDCIDNCRGIPAMPSPGYTWQSGANSGDTLGCRLYYASAALADSTANCDAAGLRPSGACRDDTTIPSCPNFCLALMTACTGELAVFESKEQCEAVCAVTTSGTKDSIDSVDTVACRTAHAFNALLVKASDHCPHTGPLGAGVCGAGGNCEAYCALAEAACQVQFADKYPDQAGCVDDCTKNVRGIAGGYSVAEGKVEANTVQCRGLAVSRALEVPEAMRDAKVCAPVFGDAVCKG